MNSDLPGVTLAGSSTYPAPAASIPVRSARPLGWLGVAFDHCRIALPQFVYSRRTDPVARLHQLALDSNPAVATGRGHLRELLTRLAFACVAVRQLSIFLVRYGPHARTVEGVSWRRQIADLWHVVWRHNTYARHYYWRKLYRVPVRSAWLENLEHRQITALLHRLNRRLPIGRITDKLLFQRHCLACDLPTPNVIAAWSEDGTLRTPSRSPIAADLFIKPASAFGSTGILILRWDAASRTHRLGSADLAWPSLLDALARRARNEQRGAILQRRLFNAPRNAVYGDFDLCNLRIVTARDPDGEPELLGAFLRLPSRFTTGGYTRHVLFAPVDLTTGILGTGRLREITRGEFPVHPETGAPILGRTLPGWEAMAALALRGHATVPWMPFVGWDLIDTTEGVQLLEANAYWGGDALQAPDARPLGQTRFPAIYLAWLERLQSGNPLFPARLAA